MFRRAVYQTRRLAVRDGAHRSQVVEVSRPEEVSKLLDFIDVQPTGFDSQWIRLPMKCGRALEELEDKGFTFHHAEGSHCTLYRWLGGPVDRVPDYATHRVGVAGMCLNDKGEALLVKERRGGLWKLPGGHADLGEDIAETAVREVFEETGVKAEFEHLLGVRHCHELSHGRSDLYFICKLKPTTTTISKCDVEIADAGWFPLSKLAEGKSTLNKFIAESYMSGKMGSIEMRSQTHAYTGKPTRFYYAPRAS
eukprot:TRINITY_DN27560_c0_g1_i1.p1 TRINITY_DN27560_c0_g1~~TRINITY_DN27560_c0_g1_i1.p1  ORF type:complete len:252 (+),score=34.33 TRINITY_DN27560_c0_g1_i1:48-803(+)